MRSRCREIYSRSKKHVVRISDLGDTSTQETGCFVVPIIEKLVTILVPILLQIIEEASGVTPNPNDPSWIAGLIGEIVSLIQKFIPSWLAPSIVDLEQLVAAELEKILLAAKPAEPAAPVEGSVDHA